MDSQLEQRDPHSLAVNCLSFPRLCAQGVPNLCLAVGTMQPLSMGARSRAFGVARAISGSRQQHRRRGTAVLCAKLANSELLGVAQKAAEAGAAVSGARGT